MAKPNQLQVEAINEHLGGSGICKLIDGQIVCEHLIFNDRYVIKTAEEAEKLLKRVNVTINYD